MGIGDKVVLVRECPMPLILRFAEDGCYRVVGMVAAELLMEYPGLADLPLEDIVLC